ncbi:Peptidase S41 family protein ustP [Psilocybe cubensis]|uniref:Peptidase S41 family protein ustP n=2 Tax=Psilocybe cubensis TaxID=181762 RepID=A0ACB8HCM8_PSICU|nr:Peptidase S41 family protein ustP [Psilocybe cubensis]KAH9485462.1 Peptidase S41 family protein ustP [Psilocybe cubensis]
MRAFTWIWLALGSLLANVDALSISGDPCAAIAGKKWVLPKEARACLSSFPLDPLIKANVLEVVSKTLAFHTSTNYQIQAPPPFDNDVHEDLVADLERIRAQAYASEFDFHKDIYYSFKRVNDGHCGVYNYCYDSLYVTYLPLPLVLLTAGDGSQNVHIAPEAFRVASAEFKDGIDFWQETLPGHLKGQLASLSGAKVFLIDGKDPFVAVNESANTMGGSQSFGTRQNSFFASYSRGASGWQYSMGNFATKAHPLVDSVELTVQRVNHTTNDTFTIPYRSRFGSASREFVDSVSYRANNCVATNTTNGVDLYSDSISAQAYQDSTPPISFFQQQPSVNPEESKKLPMNVVLDGLSLTDIDLPEHLQPSLPSLNQSYSVAQFYILNDNLTGVLALGSFSAKNFTLFGASLLEGLLELKAAGVKRLIVDVTNNGGGYICIAHWLHRIIIGPKDSTEPQAGLDSAARSGPLAQLIVQRIADGADPKDMLIYSPTQWSNASHHQFPPQENWLKPTNVVINGHNDSFSQRLGQECQPFEWAAPDYALFDPQNILIVSNGKCGSSCSLFSITMAKLEGVRTVVFGGKADVRQQYCGTVGGQSLGFSSIDTDIKSTKLKNHTLAPPDFLTNSVQGITWRLGYGIEDRNAPEEWQSHYANISIPLTFETVNNPVAIWEHIARKHFAEQLSFVLQTNPLDIQ